MPPLHRSHMCVMHVLLSAHLRLCFPVDGVVSVLCSGVECRSICSVYLTLLQRAVICLYSNVMYGVYLRMYSRKHVQMSYLSVSFTGYCMRGASNLHCLAHSPFRLCFHTVKWTAKHTRACTVYKGKEGVVIHILTLLKNEFWHYNQLDCTCSLHMSAVSAVCACSPLRMCTFSAILLLTAVLCLCVCGKEVTITSLVPLSGLNCCSNRWVWVSRGLLSANSETL